MRIVRWTRNIAFAFMVVLIATSKVAPVLAFPLACYAITPSGPGAECMTNGWENCTNHPNGPLWDFCTFNLDETCEEYCGSNPVVETDCWAEGLVVDGGGGQFCQDDLFIWCKCSDE